MWSEPPRTRTPAHTQNEEYGPVAIQNPSYKNENLQEFQEVHEQIQAYFSSTSEILDQTFNKELDRMAKDAYSETLRYTAHLQSIFDVSEEKLQISQGHDMLDGSD